MGKRASSYIFVLAIVSGMAVFLATTVALLAFPDPLRSHSLVLTVVPSCVLAAAFGYRWPGQSWKWGLWVSAGFWLYFGVVFASYLINGTLEWMPMLQLCSVLVGSCLASLAGAKLSAHRSGRPVDA